MAICTCSQKLALPTRAQAQSARKNGATVKAVSGKSQDARETQFKPKSKFETAKLSVNGIATAAVVSALSSPLAVEAAITPSLKNTLLSVVAGGVVLAAIAAAVIGVSSFDKVTRK